jgi:hypothetical protein
MRPDTPTTAIPTSSAIAFSPGPPLTPRGPDRM